MADLALSRAMQKLGGGGCLYFPILYGERGVRGVRVMGHVSHNFLAPVIISSFIKNKLLNCSFASEYVHSYFVTILFNPLSGFLEIHSGQSS